MVEKEEEKQNLDAYELFKKENPQEAEFIEFIKQIKEQRGSTFYKEKNKPKRNTVTCQL
ncbi:MAG: hypothetical protein KAJ51_13780 [Thermoplasmata archaeon]|nr:hypothetical protein [Thermoplasmata archaeon]